MQRNSGRTGAASAENSSSAGALEAIARRAREDEERQERAAEANKASRELESRLCAAERLAKAAGVPIERWLGSLPSEEAAKYTDLRERLIERERLEQRGRAGVGAIRL